MAPQKSIPVACLFLIVVCSSACAPKVARLYSPDAASPPIEMHYKGGKVWIGDRARPTCQGEYKTSAHSGSLLAGTTYGSAMLICSDGVLECDFEFSDWSGQGTGICIDNARRRYRVMF